VGTKNVFCGRRSRSADQLGSAESGEANPGGKFATSGPCCCGITLGGETTLEQLRRLSTRAEAAESLDELLGLEGAAGRCYFGDFGGMLKATIRGIVAGGLQVRFQWT